MDEFKDFPLDNLISGYTKDWSAPIITGDGDRVLDLSGDADITETESGGYEMDPEEKPVILGPVQRDPPITGRPAPLSYAIERFRLDVRDEFRINSWGRLYAEGGHNKFGTLNTWVIKYCNKYGDIDLFDVNDKWLKDFVRYLHTQPIALNYISTLINNLHAVVRGYITDGLALNKLTIRVWPEVADAVFNPVEELETILKVEYSHEAYKQVSEIFVMQSFLGFRVGTLEKFLKEPQLYLIERKGKWYIRIRTNKTGVIVVVPLKEIVIETLRKRNYRFESAYYERYYNRLIKGMAEEAGITDLIPWSQTVKGRLREFIDPKFELMSSHTARRNFATNAWLAKIDVDSIMWITGHKTRESFFKYIKADSFANAINISGHPFFK